MKKFLKKYKRILAVIVGYALTSIFIILFSFLYSYFRNPLTPVGIFVLIFLLSYSMSFWLKTFLRLKPYYGEYRNELLSFSKENGILIKEIYVRKKNKSNAWVMGFGNSKSVTYNSNIFEKHPYDEIRAVSAHELGHHKNGDPLLYTLIIAFILPAVSWFNASYNEPNLILYSLVISAVILLIILFISRQREKQADLCAKRILNEPAALARFLERVVAFEEQDGTKIPKNPNFLYKIFLTHPWIYERIKYLKD